MMRFAVELRDHLPGDEGFRPSFVGHILVEMLIDSTLMNRDPTLAMRYYAAIASVSPEKVDSVVSMVAQSGSAKSKPNGLVNSIGLAGVISRFGKSAFLYDYAKDDTLLARLNQVMLRAGLPLLPIELTSWLAAARAVVDVRCDALLTPDPSS